MFLSVCVVHVCVWLRLLYYGVIVYVWMGEHRWMIWCTSRMRLCAVNTLKINDLDHVKQHSHNNKKKKSNTYIWPNFPGKHSKLSAIYTVYVYRKEYIEYLYNIYGPFNTGAYSLCVSSWIIHRYTNYYCYIQYARNDIKVKNFEDKQRWKHHTESYEGEMNFLGMEFKLVFLNHYTNFELGSTG